MLNPRRFQTVMLLTIGLAIWPVVVWWCERAVDGSDEPWGIGALLLLLFAGRLFPEAAGVKTVETKPWIETAVLLGYAVSFPFLPNLVRGMLAAILVGVVVSKHRGTGAFHFGTWGLVGMTLPWLASLQFFLGYPLRWITTQCTRVLLNLGGVPVTTDGLTLMWGPVSVWVDGPCSGVRMLWVGIFLAFAIAFVLRLKNWATVLLVLSGIVATVIGNVCRAAAVFYLEADIIDAPAFFHEGAGIVAFIVICVFVIAVATQLGRFSVAVKPQKTARPNAPFIAAVLVAVVVPFATPSSDGKSSIPFPGFPSEIDGERLSPRELSERDLPYLEGFPGKIAAFTNAKGEHVLVRWVHSPTRRLHSAADCYRGLGYEVKPLPSPDGWARFKAEKEDDVVVFEERISDGSGKIFLDTGAWYWSAMFRQTTGPWWNVVRTER